MNLPWLSLVVWLPLVGALALLAIPANRVGAIKAFANGWAVLSLVAALQLVRYDTALGGVQFIEDHDWIPTLGARYTLGVDGISVVLILLAALLGTIAVQCSWSAIATREKEYYLFLLLLQTATVGAFASMDLFLFCVFLEATLVPTYLLIAIWGGERRLYAAIRFILYALLGSAVMMLAVLKLYLLTTDPRTVANVDAVRVAGVTLAGTNAEMKALLDQSTRLMQAGHGTFNILALQALGGAKLVSGVPLVPLAAQLWIFAGLFVGFAFRVPLFPFHTWLPDAHAEAPTAVSVILAGVMLKLGGYGFVRFSLPMLPDASRDPRVLGVVVTLAIVGIVYGALCSMYYVVTSGDMKRLVAYSSVSHMGMVVLGLFSLDPNGINGAVMQMVNHGISTGALFLIVGLLYERRRTHAISDYRGLSSVAPGLAAVFLIATLASIGMPILNGFVGQFLVLRGAFEASPWWAIGGAAGVALGAIGGLWLYHRTMFGPLDEAGNDALPDLTRREWASMLPLVALAFWLGVYPRPALDYFARTAQMVSYQVWHRPGVQDRYASTPEGQEELVRRRANETPAATPSLDLGPQAAPPQAAPPQAAPLDPSEPAPTPEKGADRP